MTDVRIKFDAVVLYEMSSLASWDLVAEAVEGTWLLFPGYERPIRIVDDSRQISQGDLFVAIKGELTDGLRYVSQAVEAGAGAVCVDRVPSEEALDCFLSKPAGLLLVKDALGAFHELAKAHRRMIRDVPLIAVTGSCGKTSIRCMVQAILEEASPGAVLATEGNTNNHFGVPRNVFRLNSDHRAGVLELGTNHPGEIAALAAIVQPDIAVVGNVGTAHIEFFGTQSEIAREKGSIFSALPADGVAVLPAEGPCVPQLDSLADGHRKVTFGFRESCADITCNYVGWDGHVWRAELGWAGAGEVRQLEWSLPGRHQAINAAAAVAACEALGIERCTIMRGLARTALPGMRMAVEKRYGVHWYNDAYNANPESARASLACFAEMVDRRAGAKYVVLGDMLELGSDHAPDEHQALLAAAGECMPEAEVIAVGPEMCRAGVSCGIRSFEDAARARAYLMSRLDQGDHVLLKGSRGIALERIMG